MATLQKVPVSNPSAENSYGMCKMDRTVTDEFPAGLRVLVVDDDLACLKILEKMLLKCLYRGKIVFDLALFCAFNSLFSLTLVNI